VLELLSPSARVRHRPLAVAAVVTQLVTQRAPIGVARPGRGGLCVSDYRRRG